MKKLLALLLAVLMFALTFAVPVAGYDYAATEPEPAPAALRVITCITEITRQDFVVHGPEDYSVRYSDPFTLSVDILVDLPDDATFTVDWYSLRWWPIRWFSAGQQVIITHACDVYLSTPAAPWIPTSRQSTSPQYEMRIEFHQPGRPSQLLTRSHRVRLAAYWPEFRRLGSIILELNHGDDILLNTNTTLPEGYSMRNIRWSGGSPWSSFGYIGEGETLHVPRESPFYPSTPYRFQPSESYRYSYCFDIYREYDSQIIFTHQTSNGYRVTIASRRSTPMPWDYAFGVLLTILGLPVALIISVIRWPSLFSEFTAGDVFGGLAGPFIWLLFGLPFAFIATFGELLGWASGGLFGWNWGLFY